VIDPVVLKDDALGGACIGWAVAHRREVECGHGTRIGRQISAGQVDVVRNLVGILGRVSGAVRGALRVTGEVHLVDAKLGAQRCDLGVDRLFGRRVGRVAVEHETGVATAADQRVVLDAANPIGAVAVAGEELRGVRKAVGVGDRAVHEDDGPLGLVAVDVVDVARAGAVELGGGDRHTPWQYRSGDCCRCIERRCINGGSIRRLTRVRTGRRRRARRRRRAGRGGVDQRRYGCGVDIRLWACISWCTGVWRRTATVARSGRTRVRCLRAFVVVVVATAGGGADGHSHEQRAGADAYRMVHSQVPPVSKRALGRHEQSVEARPWATRADCHSLFGARGREKRATG